MFVVHPLHGKISFLISCSITVPGAWNILLCCFIYISDLNSVALGSAEVEVGMN